MIYKNSISAPGTNDQLKFYFDLVEASQDLIFQIDVRGRFTFLNPAWEATSGYTIEELLGRKITEFIAPGMREEGIEEFARVLQGESFKGYETVFLGKIQDQIYLNFNAKVVRDEKGSVVGAQGTAQDVTRFKLAEKALRESEENFRILFEENPMPTVLSEIPSGKIAFANKRLAALMSLDPGAIVGKTAVELGLLKNPGDLRRLTDLIMDRGYIDNVEVEKVDPGSQPGADLVSMRLITMAGKQYCLTVVQDISERKQMENALRESENRFRKIIEQAPIAMAIVSMEGIIEYINEKAVKVFGYLPEDIPTMERWWVQAYPDEMYRKEVVADWMGRIQKALEVGGEIAGNEYRTTCKDGSETIMFISGVPVSNKVFVLFDDITERKRLDAALRESEKRHKIISELASDYTYKLSISEDGNVSMDFISENFYSITGRSREDVMTVESWSSVVHAEDIEKLQRLLQGLIASPQTAELECRSYIHGRNLRWVNVIARSEWDESEDRVTTIVGAIKDITERKRVEEELQKTQKLESLGVLAGGIAHDFNNLLTGIFGYLDLARSISTEAQVTEYLEATLSSMNRARALTLQLLTFAKGGAPVLKTASLLPFISETVRFALSGSNISCEFFLADNLWSCNIDKNQIGQVINNIVINAQQAMPSGGSIEITARNISISGNEYPLLARGDYVKVSIKDFGIGIPMDILPRIFDPFYTTKTKGHGLGLATCYSIIKRHNGCIDVESEPGKGSNFHIFLPASREIAVATVAADIKHMGSGTIVVMDDEEAIRTTVKKMLELKGYTVECKKNGREAVDFYLCETRANHPIDAMIFDLTIPGGMGGVEAVAEVRKAGAKIPVFVASGYAENEAMKTPALYGFTASICKPFTIAELVELLNTHCKRIPRSSASG